MYNFDANLFQHCLSHIGGCEKLLIKYSGIRVVKIVAESRWQLFWSTWGLMCVPNFMKLCNGGVSYLIFCENTQKGYIFKPPNVSVQF